jgi:hypothetical protein
MSKLGINEIERLLIHARASESRCRETLSQAQSVVCILEEALEEYYEQRQQGP